MAVHALDIYCYYYFWGRRSSLRFLDLKTCPHNSFYSQERHNNQQASQTQVKALGQSSHLLIILFKQGGSYHKMDHQC